MPAATVSVAWTTEHPEPKVARVMFGVGGVSANAVMADGGSVAIYTFVTPWAGRLRRTSSALPGAVADIDQDQGVLPALWPTHVVNGNTPGVIPAGITVTVRDNNSDSVTGDPVGDYFEFEEAVDLGGVANTEATASSAPTVTFDNSAPSVTTSPAVTFDNNAPGSTTSPTVAFDNNAPEQKVLTGEQAPVAGVTAPVSTAVAHTFPLVAGTNYFVKVGTRAAPVTINLPDPGSDGQRIEVADLSGQGVTFPITVSAGTKQIEGAGTSYLVNRAYAVLALVYADGAWKLV